MINAYALVTLSRAIVLPGLSRRTRKPCRVVSTRQLVVSIRHDEVALESCTDVWTANLIFLCGGNRIGRRESRNPQQTHPLGPERCFWAVLLVPRGCCLLRIQPSRFLRPNATRGRHLASCLRPPSQPLRPLYPGCFHGQLGRVPDHSVCAGAAPCFETRNYWMKENHGSLSA